MQQYKPGDFTGLADNYSKYRPGYAAGAVRALFGYCGRSAKDLDVVDVGAGTGIWTRILAAMGPRSLRAVEPNDDMRSAGMRDSADAPIEWHAGTGEATGLNDASADLLCMASSFHWAYFDSATTEFARVLRPQGVFAALWNPRVIEANPLLVEIEDKLYKMAPHIKRRSSGRAAFTDTLTERLADCGHFDDVVYIEGRHVARQTREHYLGVWRSVNDVRSQAGEATFAQYLEWVAQRIAGIEIIETVYQTRLWATRRG